MENCGISIGARTVAYDFAQAVLTEHAELWNEEEKAENFVSILHHWTEFSTEDLDSFLKYDITGMNIGEYYVLAMSMFLEDIRKEWVPAFSYATYIFFLKGYDTGIGLSQYNRKELKKAIAIAEDDFRRNSELEES